jgi:hypothetical protein
MVRGQIALTVLFGGLVLSGCLRVPSGNSTAPSSQVSTPPGTQDTPVTTTILIEDNRPDWERHDHPLVESPAGTQAIGNVAIDHLHPSPLDSLTLVVDKSLSREPGETISVKLETFRVIINDPRSKQQARENSPVAPKEANEDNAPRDGAIDDPVFATRYQWNWQVSSDSVPLSELPRPYYPGVTCDIEGMISVHRDGEHNRSFSIAASKRVAIVSIEGAEEVSRAIGGALREFAVRLGDDVPPRSRIRRTDTRTPDFPERAGKPLR